VVAVVAASCWAGVGATRLLVLLLLGVLGVVAA
jgi:hypothetical protein